MSELNRRDALKAMGAVPLAGMLDWSVPGMDRATKFVAALHTDDVADSALEWQRTVVTIEAAPACSAPQ